MYNHDQLAYLLAKERIQAALRDAESECLIHTAPQGQPRGGRVSKLASLCKRLLLILRRSKLERCSFSSIFHLS